MNHVKRTLHLNLEQNSVLTVPENIPGGNINAYIRGLIAEDMGRRGIVWPKDKPVGREKEKP